MIVFYNDVSGYMGDDRTNSDSNAYFNHTIYSSRGPQWFWVFEDDDLTGHSCSADLFYVQSLPTINSNHSVYGGSSISTVFWGSIDDSYSERGLAGLPPKIKIKYYNQDYNKTYYSYPTSSSYTFGPQCDGVYKVTAYIDDGLFISSKVLDYNVLYTGGTGCVNPL